MPKKFVGTMNQKSIKSFFWWVYYTLFLGVCIFIFVTVVKYIKALLFTGSFNLAKFLYGAAVAIMIFGLLSMSIAYLARTIWYRIKGQTNFPRAKHHRALGKIERGNLALHVAEGERLEEEIISKQQMNEQKMEEP